MKADSTFALAWLKRAQSLGWSKSGSDEETRSAQRAVDLSARLPFRYQKIARGYVALNQAMALPCPATPDTAANNKYFAESARLFESGQKEYRELLARDSMSAEAWYGYGESLYHAAGRREGPDEQERLWSGAQRAFQRTLDLDPTFHLAYSHMVSTLQTTGADNAFLVLVGDSIRVLGDSARMKRIGDSTKIAGLRARARPIGLNLARSWVRADPAADEPLLALANMFLSFDMPDSAASLVDAAIRNRPAPSAGLRFNAGLIQLRAGDPRAPETYANAINAVNGAEAQRMKLVDRGQALAGAASAAAMSGNGAAVDRAAKVFLDVNRNEKRMAGVGDREIGWLSTAIKVALSGEVKPEQLRDMVTAVRAIDSVRAHPTSTNRFLSTYFEPAAFLMYSITRDTLFAAALQRWRGNTPDPTIDVALALGRGDSTEARKLAAKLTPLDQIRNSGVTFGYAGLRTALRGDLAAELGNTDEAVGSYEALKPSRFSIGFIEPGFAVYVRTFAARARLYEKKGERDKAIAAWEEVLRRWKDGDAITEPARKEARAALNRLRDAGR